MYLQSQMEINWDKLREVVTLCFQASRVVEITKSFGDDNDHFCLLDCTHLSPCQGEDISSSTELKNLSKHLFGARNCIKYMKLSRSASLFKEFIA